MESRMRVLHVDDEKPFLNLTRTILERIDDRFVIDSVTDTDEASERLSANQYDCIVSDYDMPGQTGISFLQSIRKQYETLPFILFTGKGGEDIASQAIANGVTGYLQKGGGTEQFKLLANRIEHAINANRAKQDLSEQIRQLETLISNVPGVVYRCRMELGWPMESVRGDCKELFGYPAENLENNEISLGQDIIHPDDRSEVMDSVESALSEDSSFELRYRIQTANGETKWVWERGRRVDETSDGTKILEGFITDITAGYHQQERQRVLFEDAADAIVEVTFEDDLAIIDRVNPAFEEIFDVSSDDVVGRSVNEVIVPPEDQALAADLDRRVRDGEIVEEEIKRVTDDGLRWFLLRTVPFTLGDERRGYATYVDITDQKERESSIEALHSATQTLFDLTDRDEICESSVNAASEVLGLSISGIFLYNSSTNALEPVATTDTIAAEQGELPRYTEQDEPIWDAYTSGQTTVIRNGDGETERLSDQTAESGLVVPIGEWGVLISTSPESAQFGDADVRLAGLLASATGSALDVARRETQLEKLHEAATEIDSATDTDLIFQRLITAAEDILEFDFAVVDSIEGDELVTEATSTAIGDESFFERTPVDAEDSVAAAVFRNGTPDLTEDLRELDVVPADPEFLSALTVPLDGHGVFQAAAKREGAFDEEDLELAELLGAHVREALTRLERTQELEDRTNELNRQNERLEKFASIVSHDLRNPLNVIAGRLELAREDPTGGHLDSIDEAAERMEAIIDHTLTLARQGRSVGETEPLDLSDMANSCWDRVATGDATLDVMDDLQFSGDSERVKQILENLFRNAIEHGSEPVIVRVGALEEGGIYIAANGPGIPEADRETVLEPGYSTSDDGVGIGLAIVAEIVNAHGWDIAITDSWSGGTRIELAGIKVLG